MVSKTFPISEQQGKCFLLSYRFCHGSEKVTTEIKLPFSDKQVRSLRQSYEPTSFAITISQGQIQPGLMITEKASSESNINTEILLQHKSVCLGESTNHFCSSLLSTGTGQVNCGEQDYSHRHQTQLQTFKELITAFARIGNSIQSFQ